MRMRAPSFTWLAAVALTRFVNGYERDRIRAEMQEERRQERVRRQIERMEQKAARRAERVRQLEQRASDEAAARWEAYQAELASKAEKRAALKYRQQRPNPAILMDHTRPTTLTKAERRRWVHPRSAL